MRTDHPSYWCGTGLITTERMITMADNHAKHSEESHRLSQERLARLIPGSPAWDRAVAEGADFPPEVAANRGLFADSGGAYEE